MLFPALLQSLVLPVFLVWFTAWLLVVVQSLVMVLLSFRHSSLSLVVFLALLTLPFVSLILRCAKIRLAEPFLTRFDRVGLLCARVSPRLVTPGYVSSDADEDEKSMPSRKWDDEDLAMSDADDMVYGGLGGALLLVWTHRLQGG